MEARKAAPRKEGQGWLGWVAICQLGLGAKNRSPPIVKSNLGNTKIANVLGQKRLYTHFTEIQFHQQRPCLFRVLRPDFSSLIHTNFFWKSQTNFQGDRVFWVVTAMWPFFHVNTTLSVRRSGQYCFSKSRKNCWNSFYEVTLVKVSASTGQGQIILNCEPQPN